MLLRIGALGLGMGGRVTRRGSLTIKCGSTLEGLEPNKDAPSAAVFGSGGAVVTAVTEGSPAAEAGLKPGDVINAVNGISLKDEELEKKIAAYRPGSTIRLGYMRGAWALKAVVTVATNAQ